MDLHRGALESGGQALEVATAHALLRRVSRGLSGPALRVYRPSSPAVAFGRRDTRLPGFADAVSAAREAGFEPVVRAPGGRAVAYTTKALVVDHAEPAEAFPVGMEARFREYGELWATVLRELGVDARVGEVPGEYCPGAQSVNARGAVKLVGTAQRMVRGAWLFSAVAIVDDAPDLRPVLASVYRHLAQPFDVSSVGSLREEKAGLSLETLEQALVAAYDGRYGLIPRPLDPAVLTLAGELVADHEVRRPAQAGFSGS